MPMDYDVIIIGAGMSGLSAGIRLAHFDKRVCILEKHYAYGGLNSYYTLNGRAFDVGLHAVTNYAKRGARAMPLTKLLRQLRLDYDDFDLRPQLGSEIRFPSARLRFNNDPNLLTEEVASLFPAEIDRFRSLLNVIRAHDDTRIDVTPMSGRAVLAEHLRDPLLIEMLLCPIMYYGSPTESDIDWTHFVTLVKSIFLQGFARPRRGVRQIITTLVKRYRACGGTLKMRCGVERINTRGARAESVTLASGETLSADVILSSAGYPETMAMLSNPPPDLPDVAVGRVSFVEIILCLDTPPAKLGYDTTITFYNDKESFRFVRPDDAVDITSGVICCPNNYEGHEDMAEGIYRLTWMANYDRWAELDQAAYEDKKRACVERALERAGRDLANVRSHLVASDMFTPLTIKRFTGHIDGAVYGAPTKRRDGRTEIENLFICGTDQGFLGIMGAMLSGITIANMHVLAAG